MSPKSQKLGKKFPNLTFRTQHNPINSNKSPESPPTLRYMDVLQTLYKRKTITSTQLEAARRFELDFEQANHDSITTSSYNPASNAPKKARKHGAKQQYSPSEKTLAAKNRVWKALESVGGINSPPGRAIWHIAGLGKSIKDFSQTSDWGGTKKLNPMMATGIFIAALSALNTHYNPN